MYPLPLNDELWIKLPSAVIGTDSMNETYFNKGFVQMRVLVGTTVHDIVVHDPHGSEPLQMAARIDMDSEDEFVERKFYLGLSESSIVLRNVILNGVYAEIISKEQAE